MPTFNARRGAGNLTVTVLDAAEVADRLASFLDANGITAAQWSAGRAACTKRALGQSLTTSETTAADRFTALTAALTGYVFDADPA